MSFVCGGGRGWGGFVIVVESPQNLSTQQQTLFLYVRGGLAPVNTSFISFLPATGFRV